MSKNFKKALITLFNIIVFYIFSSFHYSLAFSFKLFNVSATLVIPLLVAFSIYHSPIASAMAGMLSGFIMDAFASDSICFNAIVLLIIGTFVSVTSSTLFNKNIPSAAVISLLSSVFYFLTHWAFFHTLREGITQALSFLLTHSLPSAVLSAVFIFPFYFLYRRIYNILERT